MKQKKLSTRMLSLVLTVAMVGTLLPATVFAAESGALADSAKLPTNYVMESKQARSAKTVYVSDTDGLQKAITDAKVDTTIILEQPVSGGKSIIMASEQTNNITIDLNGKTLSCYNEVNGVIAYDGVGDLTITDTSANKTGVVTLGRKYGNVIVVGSSSNSRTGTFNLKGGTIRAEQDTYSAITQGYGSINITGGTVQASDAPAIRTTTGKGTITISEENPNNPTLITSACTKNTTGTIHLTVSKTTNPTIVLDVQGGTVSNTASPEGYSVYFWDDEIVSDIVKGYFAKGDDAEVGRVFPTPPPDQQISLDSRNGDKAINKTIKADGTITKPADPAWNDYTFAGWYTGIDGAGTVFSNSGLSTSATVYAKWTKDGKTVRTTPLDLTGAAPANPGDQGWTWDSTGKTLTLSGATIDCTGNAPASGVAFGIQLKVGDEIVLTVDTTNTVKAGNASNDVSSGINFDGSNTNSTISGAGTLIATGGVAGPSSENNGIATCATLTVSNATIIATGSQSKFGYGISASLIVNSGTIKATGETTGGGSAYGIYGTTLAMTGGKLSASGTKCAVYAGSGITATDPTIINGTADNGDFVSGTTKSLTQTDTNNPVVISFTKSVTFDARNGVIKDADIDKDTSTIAALPANPEWTGYTFGGWYTGVDGAGTEFKNENLTANTTVYAKWTKGDKTVRTTPLDLTTASVTPAPDQGWTWDESTSILTLDGATIDCSGNAVSDSPVSGIQLMDNCDIVLKDSTVNTVKAGNATDTISIGINFSGGFRSATPPSISGKGTLYATGGETRNGNMGIMCSGATLTFRDATIIASSSAETITGIGILGLIDVQSGTITATGTGSTFGYGIQTLGMAMSGGTVTATGTATGTVGMEEYGVYGYGAFEITGGTLSASGKTAAVSIDDGDAGTSNDTITAADGANVTGANETFASGTTKTLTQSGAKPVVISFTSKSDYTGTNPSAPVADSKTDTSITLKAQTITGETVQYGIDKDNDGTATWQDSPTFNLLSANTKYKFYTRVKANTIHNAGKPSVATEITTKKAPASVSGNVKDSTGQNVSGATVTLTPSNPALTATTGANGNYSFARVPEGVYSLVVTNGTGADKITITEIVIVAEAPITGKNIILLSGNKSTVVETKPNTPPTAADKLNDLFDPAKVGENEDDAKGITKTDLTTVTNGGSVTVTLTSTQKTEAEVQAAADAIKNEATGEELLFLDFAVTKVVTPKNGTAGTPIKMTELPAVVEIVVEIPEALRSAATISVYRTHDGKTTKFATKADANGEYAERRGNYMHVFAKYFSTYALGYNTGGGSTGGDGSATITYPNTVNKPQNGTVTTNPASPFEGQTVTITTKPDAGYVVDTIIVKDADGKTIAVTKNGENSYSFVQPGNKVTVEVTYKKPGTKTFTDVTANDWFYNAVMEATANGWFSGTSATTFDPYASTTRGMIATVLQRVDSTPKATTASFDDVAPDAYYASGVAWAQANNIVVGYGDGNYGPNDNITREQLAAILYRYAGYKGYDVSKRTTLDSFTDGKNVSDYAKEAMSWAVGSGLISGRGNNILAPTATATRAEVAAILVRFDELFTK